jgi:hypothetical protein
MKTLKTWENKADTTPENVLERLLEEINNG